MYKAGDKLECLVPKLYTLEKGDIVTVQYIDYSNPVDRVAVLCDGNTWSVDFRPNDFRLVMPTCFRS